MNLQKYGPFPYLSPEIWMKVMKKSEPSRLIPFRRVSKEWKNLIDKTIYSVNWKHLCLRDIPEEFMCQMLIRKFPSMNILDYRDIYDNKIWQHLYFSFRRWQLCTNGLHSTKVICNFKKFLFHQEIVCIEVCDAYLAVAVEPCSIFIYGINNLQTKTIKLNTKESIREMRFWYTAAGELILVSSSHSHNIQFWDLRTRTEILTSSQFVGKNLCIGTSHNLYACSYNNIVEFKRIPDGIRYIRLFRYPLRSEESIKAMYSEGRILIVLKATPHFTISEHYEILPCNKSIKLRQIYNQYSFMAMPFLDVNYHFLSNKAAMIIWNNYAQVGYIAEKNYYNYYTLFYTKKSITSCTTHGNLIILGYQTGEVLIFMANYDRQDKDRPWIAKKKILQKKEIYLSKQPIITVKMVELNEMPYILAATKYKIYAVKLYYKNNNNNNI